MRQIRKRLTYANVMSSIAVFLVIGGGAAFAAVNLPANSVGSRQIKKNAVKTNKIGPKAVKVGKLAPEAVKAAKLAQNAVTTNRIRNDAVATSKVQDGAVTGQKIAPSAVTNDKIGAGAVARGNLADGALLPRGYAYVDSDGTVSSAINIPDASTPAEGTYCFDLAFIPTHAQATGEADGSGNDMASVAIAGIGDSLTNCPAGTEVEVEIWDTAFDEANEEQFYLVVW